MTPFTETAKESPMKRYSIIILVVVFAVAVLAQNGTQTSAQQPATPAAPPAAAPAAPNPNPLSTDLRQMYTGVKNNLLKMAEKMPEEHYAFKATPEVRSFGQLIGHVADSQARTCSMINGEPKNLNASARTTKAELVAALRESFALCDQAMEGMTDARASETISMGQRQSTRLGALARTVSHSNEEYGYMAVYLRLKGIVPPSSEGR